jgi:hypothetical protein
MCALFNNETAVSERGIGDSDTAVSSCNKNHSACMARWFSRLMLDRRLIRFMHPELRYKLYLPQTRERCKFTALQEYLKCAGGP